MMLWLMSSAARAVPGFTLAGERWCKEGRPVAWHLAVKPANVGQFERDLQALEVASCVGCFTWYASGGTPAELEAADPARLLEHSKRLDAEQGNLSIALCDLCDAPASEMPDDPEFAKALEVLQFLDRFATWPPEITPPAALLREFIGDGAFDCH